MKAEFLISTTNRSNIGFLDKMFAKVNPASFYATVVNQCYSIKPSKITSDLKNRQIISVDDKGLSKSRNLAIKNATEDICVIADDDVVYLQKAIDIILSEYQKDNNLDVAVFQIVTPEGKPYKKYKSNSYQIKKAWDQWHVSSVEITFKRKSLIEKGINFNENLGLGSSYTGGEEVWFINECVNKGLIVKYFPIPIVIHPQESSGKTYSKGNAIATGVIFAKLFPFWFLLFDLYFSIKWYRRYYKEFSFFKYIGWMLKGNWLTISKKI